MSGCGHKLWKSDARTFVFQPSSNTVFTRFERFASYKTEPVTVKLVHQGGVVSFTDVLTGVTVNGAFVLQPLEVRLVRLKK